MPTPRALVGQPLSLPCGFEAVGVQATDAAAVYELVSACDMAVLGRPDYSREEVESDIGALAGGAERAQVLVRRSDSASGTGTGDVVAWWWSDPHPGSSKFFADVYLHPALTRIDGDAIAAAGWSTAEVWARDFYARDRASHDDRTGDLTLVCGSIRGDVDGERRVKAAGFTHARTFWRMAAPVLPLTSPTPEPPATPPAGLAIVPATDRLLVHTLREETFADHWEHEPESYADWEARMAARAKDDMSLWSVAEMDGEPVGLLICTRQMASDDTLYVATLGVLPAYRRRGIAAALLKHAFAQARESGYAKARLNVDSDSPTGAPSVYRRAGYEVLFAMNAWRKPLVGADDPVGR